MPYLEKMKSAYAISVAVPDWLDEIRGEYAKDPDTSALINDPNRGPKFEWRNDILGIKEGFT